MSPHTRGSRNSPYGAYLRGLLENVACNLTLTSSGFEIIALIFRDFCESLNCVLRELHARVWVARWFLTPHRTFNRENRQTVLMHLLALGAF